MTANRKGRGLTRGRLRPFSCSHKGWGAECNRCAQAKQLQQRVMELEQLFSQKQKNPTYPSYVIQTANEFCVKGGGNRFTVTNKLPQHIIPLMKNYIQHLLKVTTKSHGL